MALAVLSKQLKIKRLPNAVGPVIALGVLIALLYFGRIFFVTSISAMIIAFILEPFVEFLIKIHFPRSVASFVVCSLALLLLYLMGLAAYTQISGLMNDVPRFSERMGQLVERARSKLEDLENKTYQIVVPAQQRQKEAAAPPDRNPRRRKPGEAPPLPLPTAPAQIPEVRIHSDRKPIADYFYSRIGSLYQILLMASFVPFLVYFMLSWQEHLHRSFLQFFEGEDRLVAAKSLQGIGDMVRGFVVGNFVLGVLLALVSSLTFWIIHVPYPLLAGPLSGFMSLVPYVGLPLALLPPIFVALAGGNAVASIVLVSIVVVSLHLLALNLFYPKLVGSRVHLNPLVVTFSLMLWGFLWDAAGIVLAIPLTAGIKAVCDNVKGLRPYGKFLGD